MLVKLVKLFSPHFREKRFQLFKKLFLSSGKKLKILDVGGTEEFWKPYKSDLINCKITILNLFKIKTTLPNFKSVVGDARSMEHFKDKEFDVVFSNSVIEHVGDFENQKKMAKEIQRVGMHYFVQTPNYYFPIEPHFLFPLFQFLPLRLKKILLIHFNLGWYKKIRNDKVAGKIILKIRLLNKNELAALFPEGTVLKERVWWFTKSYIIYR